MSQQGEAAEQIVSMATNVTVKGVECLTNLAGRGALSLATFLVAALKDEKRTSGKARMRAFNGKPTKVFAIKAKDLKLFAEEARKYGVLYAAVINKKQPDGIVDVVVNANDAARVNRITERFALSTVDVEKIRADIMKAREEKAKQGAVHERTTPSAEKGVHTVDENTLDAMMAKPVQQATTHILHSLNDKRNELVEQGKDTEFVDDTLIEVMDAPMKREKKRHRDERER